MPTSGRRLVAKLITKAEGSVEEDYRLQRERVRQSRAGESGRQPTREHGLPDR